jgi:methyl-accepting chemotaxis protein
MPLTWHATPTRREKVENPMPLQVAILEESFDLVAPRGEELIERFYERLFDIAPEVRPLFAGTDMPRQRQMLLGALVLLRKSLRNLGAIVPALQAMGARHAGYGARPEHYPIVGAALLSSLAEIGGSAWTAEYNQAWADAYQVVQDTMLSGAAQAGSAPDKQPVMPAAAAA